MNSKPANKPRPAGVIIGVTSLLLGAVILGWSLSQNGAPATTETNLLPEIDPATDIQRGIGELVDDGLLCEVNSEQPATIMLVDDAPNRYEVQVEFRANPTTEEIGFILGVGDRHVRLVVRNEAGGLDAVRMATLDSPENSTRQNRTIFVGKDELHRVKISCEYQPESDQASITAIVDGESYLQWSGDAKELSIQAEQAIAEQTVAMTFRGLRSQLLVTEARFIRHP